MLNVSKKYKPDLTYATGADGVPSVFLISKISKIPSITKLFGTFLYPRINNKIHLLLSYTEVLAFKIPCSLLIILNDGTRGDEVAERLKVPAERIRFWMDGVNKEMYNPNFDAGIFKESIGIPANSKVILSVSRLEKWKGVHRLVNSIPTIISKVNDVAFCICGDGSEREELEKLCEKLGVRNYVKFMGAVDYNKLQNFYNMADIFVSLYDVSNVGNPLLEAMSCGRCIVTLDVGTTNQLIKNRENGIVLEPDKPKELSNTLVNLLNDDNLRNQMGGNAKNYAFSHFQTWGERMNMELEEIKELIKWKY
jgi:glycosyltransferase involved in cell wall biosynthesis